MQPMIEPSLSENRRLRAMRTIELSDETIAALQSQAAAQGMSLEAWFENWQSNHWQSPAIRSMS
jgi:hypothetical protein